MKLTICQTSSEDIEAIKPAAYNDMSFIAHLNDRDDIK